jgi:DNA-binding NarL/FixJ family response regulator
MIRILIVEDQKILRHLFQELVEARPNLSVVGTAEDAKSALERVKFLKPNIALIDIEMPGMDGITVTQKICQYFPTTKVLILSNHENEEYVTRALRAGAKGYLLKDTLAEELEKAIWSIYRGYSHLESRFLERVISKSSSSNVAVSFRKLEATQKAQTRSASALKRSWLFPLLGFLGVIATLGFRFATSLPVNSETSDRNLDCRAPTSLEEERSQYEQICLAMQDVLNVPKEQFFYGGTMGAAALRSRKILNEIEVAHPEFRLRYLDPLVAPPDSSTGIKMLLNGKLSFAESQRPLREEEYEQAKNRGFLLKQIPVAITGVAFYINPSLHLPGLSLDQLQAIYIGRITNWKQVGAPDLPIVAVR